MARFAGKQILVAGGTNGIGLAGVRRIAAEDGLVIATGTDQERIDHLREELPEAAVWHNEAADPDTGTQLARQVRDSGRGLDGLWLNAGYADVAPVGEVTAKFFDRMMAVNVRSVFLQLAALSDLLNDGAAVVITSSTGAVEGSPLATVYAATKGALEAASRGWATALASRNIRVNTVVPGNVDTDFRRFMDDDTREAFNHNVISRVPLGRAGTADETAAVACFLLSEDAAYVSGSRYYVDGGLSRR